MLKKLFEDVSREEKFFFFMIFFIVIQGMFISWINVDYFKGDFVREDGLVEWLQFHALCFAALVSYARIFIYFKTRDWFFLLTLLGFALVFTFGAGEEISWGQRIFGIHSSEFFAQHNSQQETNLHNLILSGNDGSQYRLNKIIFGTFLGICIGIYFLILPVLYRKFEGMKKLINRFGFPLPKYFHLAAYLLLAVLVALTKSSKHKELLELGGCWIFFMMILFPLNKEIFKRN